MASLHMFQLITSGLGSAAGPDGSVHREEDLNWYPPIMNQVMFKTHIGPLELLLLLESSGMIDPSIGVVSSLMAGTIHHENKTFSSMPGLERDSFNRVH
jgi:hypothetical protein